MKNIKTKETTKDIKLFDAKANMQRNIKRAVVRTKDTVENLIDDGKVSPSELYPYCSTSDVMTIIASRAVFARWRPRYIRLP